MTPLRRKKKFAKVAIILLICVLIFVGVGIGQMIWRIVRIPTTLNDIAFDVNPRHGYTVYILENGEYVPYLVLTNNYGGVETAFGIFGGSRNVLLLRKYLLDEMMVFNYLQNEVPEGLIEGVDFLPAYYRTSKIDGFLNGEFLARLSSIEDIIVNSEIVITHIDSIGRTGNQSQTIERKVFLLSLMEVTRIRELISVAEGRGLRFFDGRNSLRLFFANIFIDDPNLRIATTASGAVHSWWLRTPNTWYRFMVYTINGKRGGSACKKCNVGTS